MLEFRDTKQEKESADMVIQFVNMAYANEEAQRRMSFQTILQKKENAINWIWLSLLYST